MSLSVGLGCTGGPAEPADGQPLKILGEVIWPVRHPTQEQIVLRTRDETVQSWSKDGGNYPRVACRVMTGKDVGQFRDVDFDREWLLVVFRGETTDHEGIRIERVVQRGQTVTVEYREIPIYKGTAPGPAWPCHAVVVPRAEGEIVFKALPPEPSAPALVP
jgi:hypothetical protein